MLNNNKKEIYFFPHLRILFSKFIENIS